MFGFFRNKAINLGLDALKERLMGEYLEGIGVIRELVWKDRQLHVEILLNGLEDRPIRITAKDIEIAPDASSIRINAYESDMPFAAAALNRYAARSFAIPEGKARVAAQAARKALAV